MFKIDDLHEYACSKTNMYFTLCDKFNSDQSVWKLPFKNVVKESFGSFHQILSCSDFFVTLYWLTLLLSSVGLMEAIYEFIRVFSDENYEPSTFGNRSYENVSVGFRRRARICGISLNIKLFVCLLYGLMNFRTSYILPWLVVYGLIIPLEFFYWICELYISRRFKCQPVLSLFVLIIRWAFTLHIMLLMNEIK